MIRRYRQIDLRLCQKPLQSHIMGPLSQMPEGVTMSNLENALRELREKRSRAQEEVEKLNQIISGIESLNGAGVSRESVSHNFVSRGSVQPKRIISAASRRKMALAQKARWAKIRKNSQPIAAVAKPGPTAVKRIISAAGRKRIAEAARARWAKIRAAKKAA